jgi:serine phosphatase RsbU (regulator of sigma subunit)/pSer/pThr/pTyr-binding forkhead associated (FHA) protein
MSDHLRIVPTLQVISGPLAGRTFKLDRETTIIGRNPESDIYLQPKSVSRKHAAITRRGDVFQLEDLGSTRGTFVNGQKLTKPVLLEDGCTIQVGELLFTFSTRAIQIHEGSDEQSTVFAAIDVLTQSDRSFPVVRPEEKLQALRLISQDLGTTLALQEILDRVFNSLFAIFPRAERGFVLLKVPGSDDLAPELIRSRTGPTGELSISKTVLNHVLDAGQAILCTDLPTEFPESHSVSDSMIRSLMCAPLFDQERKPVGIIQIDTRDGRSRFGQDDLDLLATVAGQISVAVQNAQLHKALVVQREMEQELQFARQVMQSLLPERPAAVPGYEFWAFYEPARHVGGDYYGFIPIDPEDSATPCSATKWAIAVGDVVGKGMPAALLSAKLAGEFKLLVRRDADPARIVEQLNRQLDEGGGLDIYITFLLVFLDTERHHLSIVNAGHPSPLIRRKDGQVEEFGKPSSGLPLAIVRDYQYQVAQTTLAPGETVILYTDGVTDSANSAGDWFRECRLRQAISDAGTTAAATGEAIVRAVQNHAADRAQFDDITLVCLSRR